MADAAPGDGATDAVLNPMKDRSLQIKEALEGLKAAERATDFQELALHLARRRWPEFVATEHKSDGGEDATSFQRNAGGQLCRLACSLTGTLEKVRRDARRQRERGLKTDVLVFITPEPVNNLEVAAWRKAIKKEFNHDLEVLGQAELISQLARPEHDWLCVRYLRLEAVAGDLGTYLDHVIGRSDKVLLAGIDPKAGDPDTCKRLDLANVYIELATDLRRPPHEGEATRRRGGPDLKGLPGGENLIQVSALEAACDHRRLALTGKPGSGKTTFIRHLCLCLAQHLRHPDQGWLERLERSGWVDEALVPMVVELRFFARSLPPELKARPEPRALWDFFVQQSLKPNALDGLQASRLRTLEAGRALVIFEGLDEVPNGTQRGYVMQAIEAFAAAAQFKANRVIVTCRSRAYARTAPHLWDFTAEKPVEFKEAPLADFDQPRILRFTRSWYAELARLDHNLTGSEAARADRLYRAIRAPSLWSQAGRPMLLTVMANVHAKNDKLPEDRAQVYAEMVEILVESWDNVRLEELAPLRRLLEGARKDKKDLIRFLGELAFEAHARDQGAGKGHDALADIPKHGKDGLLERLAAFCGSRDRAAELIEAIEQRAGLLVSPDPGSDLFQFPHRSFQEYLAGAHLADMGDFDVKAVELVEEAERWARARAEGAKPGEPAMADDIGYWDETLKWAAGWIAHVCDTTRFWKDVPTVANALCDDEACGPATRRHKITLAAELLIEMGRDKLTNPRTVCGARCLDRVQRLLLERCHAGELPAPERVEAGRLLGALGDPRPAIVPRSLDELGAMEFCYVPPGPFWMGEEANVLRRLAPADGCSLGADLHRCTVLDQGYWIARFPVTVAQFNLFVNDGGYRAERWWPEAIQAGLWKQGQIASLYSSESGKELLYEWREWPADPGPRFTEPNDPVVNLNWYEALALCRWLSTRFVLPRGFQFGLPSEAEWEKAARGGEQVLVEPAISAVASGLVVPQKFVGKPNPMRQRAYPWGEDPDANLANFDESQATATSKAGCFSGGCGPYGTLDQSGNVCEWTRSLWGEDWKAPTFRYPYTANPARHDLRAPKEVLRAVRGGHWGDYYDAVRCAYRYGANAGFRGGALGFRVVVSPFSEL